MSCLNITVAVGTQPREEIGIWAFIILLSRISILVFFSTCSAVPDDGEQAAEVNHNHKSIYKPEGNEQFFRVL